MTEDGPKYKSYLLRLWWEDGVSASWRASLKSITEESEPRHFPDMESLVDFLFAELGTSRPSSADGYVPDEEGEYDNMTECQHLDQIRDVKPSAEGCEECLKTGGRWVSLRLCLTCGHVGCCDSSPGRHARQHFHETDHPIVQEVGGWGNNRWCYVDNVQIS